MAQPCQPIGTNTLPSARAPAAKADSFVPPAGLLLVLASGLAEKNPTAYQAWAASSIAPDYTNAHELAVLLGSVVPFQHLARFVHRLQRRSAGLGDDWARFCDANGQQNPDPHASEPRLLIKFICWAIACAPHRVAALKGPFDPFLEVAVQIAAAELQRNEEASPDRTSKAPPAAVVTTAELDQLIRHAQEAKPFDVKDDSTAAPSLSDRSDVAILRSDVGSSDNEATKPLSAAAWLGPEPSEAEGVRLLLP